MATRGRKPKPTALKLLEGNPGKRPLNGREPVPPRAALKCPAWLLPDARWKEAEAFITQHGSIFQTPSGYVQQVPQESIAQQNLKIMQSFCSEFGLTPATRARIIAGGGSEDGASEDPMERLLKGEW